MVQQIVLKKTMHYNKKLTKKMELEKIDNKCLAFPIVKKGGFAKCQKIYTSKFPRKNHIKKRPFFSLGKR